MFHKSARGKVINFDELVHKNAKTIAVGNANLNARGELIGRGGQVVETAEQRSAASTSVSTTTSKASIQSEISTLKNARNQWSPAEGLVPVENIEEAQQFVEDQQDPLPSVEAKKKRNITESE